MKTVRAKASWNAVIAMCTVVMMNLAWAIDTEPAGQASTNSNALTAIA